MRRVILALWLVAVGCGGAARQPAAAPVPPPALSAPSLDAKRAAFARGYGHVTAQQYAQAIAVLDPLCPLYAELEDYCLHYLALSHAQGGDTAAADALWARLESAHPQSLFAGRAALERARLLRRQGDLSGARDQAEAARMSDDDEVAGWALLELADIELVTGSPALAHADLMSVRTRAPGSPYGQEAKRRALELRLQDPALEPRGPALEEEARLLLKEGDFGGAREVAERLLASAPTAAHPDLLRLRADAELGGGDTEGGLATLNEIVVRYPDSAAAPDALYRYASLLWNRDRNAEANAAFLEFRRRYPGHPRSPDVLYALGRIAQGEGRDAEAMRWYEELAQQYPSATVAREARWRIGWIAYQGGRYHDAAAAFARAAQAAGSGGAPEAEYWEGRALERAGEHAEAERRYRAILASSPASYYAHLAEQRLGQPPPAANGAGPAAASALGAAPPGTDAYHWMRATELNAIGLRTQARAELRAYERAGGDDPRAVASLLSAYQAVDGYRDAIRLGSAHGYTDPAIFFPLAFWPQLSRSTGANGPDPLLVLALMRQESMFDPAARSPADARGLMQLLPSTAERTARNIGAASPNGRLSDPETNITLGVAHLRELLDAYQGDTVKALAAYNGGQAAVARWETRFGHLPPDEFVENITYRETRDYVKRVLGNYRRYQIEYSAR